MKFTKDDISLIKKIETAQKIKLSAGEYYVKKAYDFENRLNGYDLAINELINAQILKKIGLISPDVYIVMPNLSDESEVFIVSEDIASLGHFYTAGDLGLLRNDSSSLYGIWQFWQAKFQDKPELVKQFSRLYPEILKMYLYDILMENWDRLPGNWGIIFNKAETEVLALAVLDNEYHLDHFLHNISMMKDGAKWFQKRKDVLFGDEKVYDARRKEAISEDLKSFFTITKEVGFILWQELMQMLTPEFYAHILTEIENTKIIYTNGVCPLVEIPDKDDLIAEYQENYTLIMEVGKEYSYGRK